MSRCELHARAAERTCSRCGAFMCDWCVKLAPSWAPDRCDACVRREPTATPWRWRGQRASGFLVLGLVVGSSGLFLVRAVQAVVAGTSTAATFAQGAVAIVALVVVGSVLWRMGR